MEKITGRNIYNVVIGDELNAVASHGIQETNFAIRFSVVSNTDQSRVLPGEYFMVVISVPDGDGPLITA
jgi:hypothetical protein